MLDRYCLYVKIYGERNTGTNFIQKLVQTNFATHCLQTNNHIYEYVRFLGRTLPEEARGAFRSNVVDIDCERTVRSDFGWKHGVPPCDHILSAPHAAYTLFVCVAKHPVAWLHSLMDHPYNPIEKPPDEFSEFIRYDWRLARRDNVAGRDRINVVDLWNIKNAAFRNLRTSVQHHVMIAYESILRDPSAFLEELGKYLASKREKYLWSIPSTKGDDMTFEQYRAKYRENGIFSSTSDEDIEFIRNRADPELVTALGYSWDPHS